MQRWREATAPQQQQQQQQQGAGTKGAGTKRQAPADCIGSVPRAAAAAGASASHAIGKEPWVTEQQLSDTGMLDDPYYVQVRRV